MNTSEAISKAAEVLGSKSNLARTLNVTPAMVHQWERGIRQVAAEHCIEIERATRGAVRCESIRPDMDWAYLRATDCAVEKLGADETVPQPEKEAA
jgi:DNA-binding transcriptional regulator YdaS (Cro superfamily)